MVGQQLDRLVALFNGAGLALAQADAGGVGDRRPERFPEVGPGQVHRHPAGFDLGEVQDVVYEAEQVAPVPGNRADEIALFLVHPLALGGQDQLGEPDDRVERGAELVGHVGQELVLELGGPHQLAVLVGQGLFAPAGFLDHESPVEPHRHLLGQRGEQGHVVVGERRIFLAVQAGDGADDHAGRPQRNADHPGQVRRDPFHREAPGVLGHVVHHQVPVGSHAPSHQRAFDRNQGTHRRAKPPGGGGHAEEAAFLRGEGNDTALTLEKIVGAIHRFFEQLAAASYPEQGCSQSAKQVQLPIPGRRGFDRGAEPVRPGQGLVAAPLNGREPGGRSRDREDQAHPVILVGEIEGSPPGDHGQSGNPAGMIQPAQERTGLPGRRFRGAG